MFINVSALRDYPPLNHRCLQGMPVRTSPTHLSEDTSLFLYQLVWRVKLQYFASTEDKDAVIVQHGLQAMSNGNNNRTCEFFSDSALNLRTFSDQRVGKERAYNAYLII